MTTENPYSTPASNLDAGISDNTNYAGFWIRSVASLIDTILILLVILPLIYIIYGPSYWTSGSLINGLLDIIISYVFPAVAVIMFWLYKSATPGKMIFKLKVISANGNEKLSLGQSVGRYLGYYLSTIVLSIGFIWVAFDKRKQGWHDKLANTLVIKES